MRARRAAAAVMAFCVLATPEITSAQIKASEHATLSQTVDGTVVTMEYHRPSLRGRGSLFGGQIHWGEVWTPGANWATIFETSKDIELDGVPVPAGRYSVWMVVNPDEWEMVLEPRDSLYHTNPPELTDEQVRFMVTPQETAHSLETLSWYFPAVRWNGADLRFHWGGTVVEMEVTVQSSYQITTTAEEVEPYLGTYKATWIPPEGADWEPQEFEETLSFLDGMLVGRAQSVPDDPDTEYRSVYIPRGEGFFISGFLVNGEIWEIVDEWVYEFFLDDAGRATGFEVRDQQDRLAQTGERIAEGVGGA